MITLIRCPSDFNEVSSEVCSMVVRHLTHTEISFVLPVIAAGLNELVKLDCCIYISTNVRKDSRLCFSVSGDTDKKRVEIILSKMAKEIHTRDPYGRTSLVVAREMLGLEPQPWYVRLFTKGQ